MFILFLIKICVFFVICVSVRIFKKLFIKTCKILYFKIGDLINVSISFSILCIIVACHKNVFIVKIQKSDVEDMIFPFANTVIFDYKFLNSKLSDGERS